MSATKTITYLTYFFPGSFFDEESTKAVAKRNVSEATKEAPKNAFAFQYHDVTTTVLDGETLSGKAKNKSPIHYIGGTVYTLEDVKRQFPNEKILISNMTGNGYERVIKTRMGNWKPLEKRDVLVPA